MALVPIQLPSGIYRNGTDLQSSNRWRDANLVRWVNNTMRPIGGWQQKSQTAANATPRGMLAWTDNSGDRYVAVGTYNKLYAYNVTGVQYDITPTLVLDCLDMNISEHQELKILHQHKLPHGH